MGTKVAPSYANLFKARLEEKLLEKARTDLQVELPLYLRYIDDILLCMYCHNFHVCNVLLIFLAATKQLYEWYFLSVCPSVCPSVRLSVCPSVTPF